MSRKRSTSFRGESNAPPVPKEFRRKPTGLDVEVLKSAAHALTFKETVQRHLTERREEVEMPRRLTHELQTSFEARSQSLLGVKKEEMALFRTSPEGERILLEALGLYLYLEEHERRGGGGYHETECHMKAFLDDTINRLFVDLSAPPVEGGGGKTEGTDTSAGSGAPAAIGDSPAPASAPTAAPTAAPAAAPAAAAADPWASWDADS